MNLCCGWWTTVSAYVDLKDGLGKMQACTRLFVRMAQPGVRVATADAWDKFTLSEFYFGACVWFVIVNYCYLPPSDLYNKFKNFPLCTQPKYASVGIAVSTYSSLPLCRKQVNPSYCLDCWHPPEDCQSSPSPCRRCFFHSSLRSTVAAAPTTTTTHTSHEQSTYTARMVLEGSNKRKCAISVFPKSGKY